MVANISRFKHHLAGTKKNVKACNSVPDNVREQMGKILTQLAEFKKRSNDELEITGSDQPKRGKQVMVSLDDTTSGTINQNSKMKLRDEALQQIVRFVHTSGIPLSCAKNPEFAKMFELVGKCGSEFVPPSYFQLQSSSLNKEKNAIDMLEEHRYEWKKTGCSIIFDEWTDTKGRIYCNFLVNSPEATIFMKSIDISDTSNTFASFDTVDKVVRVLDEIVGVVGEENIVQVITNNVTNYKFAVERLVRNKKRIFWSLCAVQLLDEILEDFENNLLDHHITIGKGKKISTFICSRTNVILMLRQFTHSKDLNGPTITRFANSYLILFYLFGIKDNIIEMFSSEQWKSNELAKTEEGEEIQQIVQDDNFWNEIPYCLDVALPIIEVLLKIESDDKPTMGFIYKEMNHAKESIRSLEIVKGFATIWKIITERWNAQLYPLYATSYYLNPQLHYDPTFESPYGSIEESCTSLARILVDCNDDLNMMTNNLKKIEDQIADFSTSKGLFGTVDANLTRYTKHPADWWDSYGKECPELQRMAIRLLSLTCSSCGSGQTWNAYTQVYPKKRSHLYHDLFHAIKDFKLKRPQQLMLDWMKDKMDESEAPEQQGQDDQFLEEGPDANIP